MLFNSATIYSIEPDTPTRHFTAEQWEAALSQHAFAEPTGLEEKRDGFYSPQQKLYANQLIIDGGEGVLVGALREDKKHIPSSALKQLLSERIEHIEATQGYKVGRKQQKEMKEDLLSELLPKALCTTRITPFIITSRLIIVGTSSATTAEAIASALIRHANADLNSAFNKSLAGLMTDWLYHDTVGQSDQLELADFALLKRDNVSVQWKNESAKNDEVRLHIKEGKSAVRIGLYLSPENGALEPVSFTLSETGVLQSIKIEDESGGSEEEEAAPESQEMRFLSDAVITARVIETIYEELSALVND